MKEQQEEEAGFLGEGGGWGEDCGGKAEAHGTDRQTDRQTVGQSVSQFVRDASIRQRYVNNKIR